GRLLIIHKNTSLIWTFPYNRYQDDVPLYSPSEFRGHFRLSKGQVEVCKWKPHYHPNGFNQTKLPLAKSVLACLWTLSNQESYRGVADRFNVTKSTLAKHLHEFCSLVNVHMAHHISWPVGQTLHKSVLGFEAAGFPNTVCAVDGCHIRIQKPHCDNPLAYYNRKQFYSVILTGFCDSQRRFTHVCVGHPGSWHDARAFRLTEVARLLEEDPLSLAPQGMYMIGDSAYPLLLQLMRPFRDNGHLTARQRNFNRKLNSARVVIEHAFGILKTKFRRLQCLYMRNVKTSAQQCQHVAFCTTFSDKKTNRHSPYRASDIFIISSSIISIIII
uniref:DDE Tnp4 domain-containing protein n=1 Tax=Astyanax mexicanus TaxID=7994 RepID=A0A3B1JM55_ASTMX